MIFRPVNNGSIMIGLLFTVATFAVVIYALLLTLSSQFDFTFRQVAYDQALEIAEAGANYYRWHLSHAPNDYKDGTNQSGPYVHDYRDPQGSLVGKYSLVITPPPQGLSIVTIESTGWVTEFPNLKRKVTAQYGQHSFATYSYLSNSSLWFGHGTTVNGPIFSNNGIRMDGTNTSTIQSAKTTYTCGVETGCWPNSQTKPGIWGNGGPQNLWEFPKSPVDFASIVVDFAAMKTGAQSSGIYLPASDASGYHLVFSSDGQVKVYKVTSTSSPARGYTPEDGCQNLYQKIVKEQLQATYSLTNKQVLFAEDTLWVDGVVKGKLMVTAARFPLDTFKTNMWITNNLTYAAKDATNTLGLIAQNDIYFGLEVPEEFEVNAAMLAQNGKIVRHHYNSNDCDHDHQSQKKQITVYGSVISRDKSYWNFGQGPGEPTSGFVKRIITYDQNLAFSPPPYFPNNPNFDFISWKEQ